MAGRSRPVAFWVIAVWHGQFMEIARRYCSNQRGNHLVSWPSGSPSGQWSLVTRATSSSPAPPDVGHMTHIYPPPSHVRLACVISTLLRMKKNKNKIKYIRLELTSVCLLYLCCDRGGDFYIPGEETANCPEERIHPSIVRTMTLLSSPADENLSLSRAHT